MLSVQKPYLDENELDNVAEVFQSRWLGFGGITEKFEEQLREYLGVQHVIAVNTGTSALHLALEALDLQPGDEVIVPSLTFVASIQAIIATGAQPVFCDIEEDSLNMDIADVATRITPRTKAVMPVHYGGFPCDMDALLDLKQLHGFTIVEDAAHAFGSSYRGRKIGSIGDVTCFSFDPIKNITCGEGGAVVTNNDEIAATIIPKRILGIDNSTWSRMPQQRNWQYQVNTKGFRYHMSNINAAIGIQQLKIIERFKSRKQTILKAYDSRFKTIDGIKLLDHSTLNETFPFFYVARIMNNRRDDFMKRLKEKDIPTGVHYIPNHMQPLFLNSKVSLPVTEQAYKEIITLPMYFEISDDEIEYVTDAVRSFFA